LEKFSDLFLEFIFENLDGFLLIRLIGYLIGYINHDGVLYNYIFYGVFHLGGWDFLWGFSFE
jgi:hypothetical protein